MLNSYVIYINLQVILRKEPFTLRWGGSIDVGLLSENHHKTSYIASEDRLLNEGVIPLLWITSYTASLGR